MAEITTAQIKALRDETGISVMQCKKALEEAGGDVEKAKVILRKTSAAIASKKADRELGAGVASAYVHAGGAVVGAIAGSAIEKNANDRKGVEVTVRLEGGKLIAITQEKDEEFRVGDRVRILSGQGATRVSRY